MNKVMSLKNSTLRITSLDGLRGIAASLVVLYHYLYRWNDHLDIDFGYISAWAEFGWLGVYIFFMISGFVIHNSLERMPSIFIFARNRWWRLFPAMFLATLYILVGYTLLPFWPAGEITFIDVIPGLFFTDPMAVSYLLGSPVESIDGVFWTIYIEVKFYVIIALLYFLVKDHNAIGILFIYLLYLVVSLLESISDFMFTLRSILSWIGAPYFIWFYLGILFKKVLSQPDNSQVKILFIFICILSAAHLSHLSIDLFLISLFIQFVFVSAFLFKPAIVILNNHVFQFIGFLSYPLYLIHQNVGIALVEYLRTLKTSPLLATSIAVFVSILCAWIITKGEKFFIRIRGKNH